VTMPVSRPCHLAVRRAFPGPSATARCRRRPGRCRISALRVRIGQSPRHEKLVGHRSRPHRPVAPARRED
jgi:hypothetical protein